MTPSTTIVTATYNKAVYLVEAAMSVLHQTREDWRWWLILDNADEATTLVAQLLQATDPRITVFTETFFESERQLYYRPSLLINHYYPKISTPYIAWLSDDDILRPNFLSVLADYLDNHPTHHAVYGGFDSYAQAPGQPPVFTHAIPADQAYDSNNNPSCRIDGGQVLHTKHAWTALGPWRLPIARDTAAYVDGVLLSKLAEQFTIYPVNTPVVIHRHTWLSEHQKA